MKQPITRTRTLILAAMLAPASALAADCAYKAEREALLDAGGARSVRIEAAGGELKVEGRTGQTRVEARGTACASSQEVLSRILLRATRVGDAIVVKVDMPDGSSRDWNEQATLDLTVIVPRIMPLDVDDGSGSAHIAHVGNLRVHDGSGELSVSDVTGDLDIEDGSGSIDVTGVSGSVRLSDESGSITVKGVGGSVTVAEDGSGGIDVTGVKGDFTVTSDGSGGIEHRNVGGQVRIPSDRRHR